MGLGDRAATSYRVFVGVDGRGKEDSGAGKAAGKGKGGMLDSISCQS